MDMIVNRLPSRTWNRLGINEAALSIEESFTNHTPEASETEGVTWVSDGTPAFDWMAMKSGMGPDMDTLCKDAITGCVTTEEGVEMEEPIRLDFRYETGEKSVSRIALHAKKDSHMKVILHITSDKEAADGISAIQTKILAEDGATVDLYVTELLSNKILCLNDIGGTCEEKAVIHLIKLELGGEKLYAGTEIDLKGNYSSFETEVGYHVHTGQKMDFNYNAVHHGRHTNDLMTFSGTLEDKAEKAFRGTIDFQRGSAGSVGTENENVLLLSDDIVNQSIPLILCKEEDVEGNHGASIGKLDEKVLFYLGTRGIGEEDAQKMIARSRMEAICNQIPNEAVQDAVRDFDESGETA